MSQFEMKLRTVPSHFHSRAAEPYNRVLAIGTPEGLLTTETIEQFSPSDITTTTYDVPPVFATALGGVFERYVAHFDPEDNLNPPDAPEYWCHNIWEVRAGQPLDLRKIAIFAAATSMAYDHLDPDMPQPVGTPIVVRDTERPGTINHSLLALGEPPDDQPPVGIGFFGYRGHLGTAPYATHLDAFDYPRGTMELASPYISPFS